MIFLTAVIFDVVSKNKTQEEITIFVDDGPIDYASSQKMQADTAILSWGIKKAIGEAVSYDIKNIAVSKIIKACSQARIPSDKLAKAGYALADVDLETSDMGVIDETVIFNFFANLSSYNLAKITNDFFKYSTLTEEEFAKMIFYYLRENGTDRYKTELIKIGKDDFVTLIGNIFYLISIFDEVNKENLSTALSPSLLQAGLYQVGSSQTEIIARIGLDSAQYLLGFDWNFEQSGEGVSLDTAEVVQKLDEKLEKLSGLYLFTVGDFAKSLDIAKIELGLNAQLLEEDNSQKFYAYSQYVKLFHKSIEKSYSLGREIDITDFDKYWETLATFTININDIITLTTKADGEINEAKNESIRLNSNNAKNAILFFVENDFSLEEIASLSEQSQEYKELAKAVTNIEKSFSDMSFMTGNLTLLLLKYIISGGQMLI